MKNQPKIQVSTIGISNKIRGLSVPLLASIICLLFTISITSQTNAMQFSYSMSSNGNEKEGSFDFIVSKSGGVIIKPVIPGDSFFSFETYIENVNDPDSKVKMLASINGNSVYYNMSLDFECENNSSKAKPQVIQIEKLGEKSLRSIRSDSSEIILHFSDKYQDYKLIAKGLFGNYLTIPIPESIQLRSENNNDTLKLVRTTEREWKEILENFSKRSADANELSAEELCGMGIGNSIGF